MSTPAAAAMNDANAAAAAPAGGAPAAGAPAAAPAANASQFWSTWTTPEQKETRDWIANKNFADPFTLAKTAQGLEREAATLRSAKGYPSDVKNADGSITAADPNARKAWNTAVGVPETPDKYDIPVPETNPYPQFKQFMAEEFHKAGVPAAMATQLAKGYESAVGKMEAQLRESENTQSQLGLKELENTWGAQYQERMAFAKRGQEWLAKETGGLSELQLRGMESLLGTPKFLAAMWKLGAGNKEGSFAGGDGGSRFTGGASEAQTRLDQITAERSAGKINDHQFREMSKAGGELDQLRDRIVAGMAPLQ